MYLVGKVLKPQGIKGEVKAEIITTFPNHFYSIQKIYIRHGDNWQIHAPESVRVSGRFVFIKFEGIDSIHDAEPLRNKDLYIDHDDLIEPQTDEYYVHDLIDMKVFDEQDQYLGEIAAVESYPANDVYVLRRVGLPDASIPALKEIVKRIYLGEKKMVIRVIDGLLDQ